MIKEAKPVWKIVKNKVTFKKAKKLYTWNLKIQNY